MKRRGNHEDVLCPVCNGLARGLFEDQKRLRSYYWPLMRLARELLRAWRRMDAVQQQACTLEVHNAVHGLVEFLAAHPQR